MVDQQILLINLWMDLWVLDSLLIIPVGDSTAEVFSTSTTVMDKSTMPPPLLDMMMEMGMTTSQLIQLIQSIQMRMTTSQLIPSIQMMMMICSSLKPPAEDRDGRTSSTCLAADILMRCSMVTSTVATRPNTISWRPSKVTISNQEVHHTGKSRTLGVLIGELMASFTLESRVVPESAI